MNQEEYYKKTYRQKVFSVGLSRRALYGLRFIRLFFVLILFSSLFINIPCFSQHSGYPIHGVDKFARSANGGWINHRTGHEEVRVYDSHLEGYVWSESIGWIRLGTHTGGGTHNYLNDSHDNYGVNNNSGDLIGYAWSTNAGWIKFDPANGGVTIDTITGDLSGYAWSESIGWIKFSGTALDFTTYKVRALYDIVYVVGDDLEDDDYSSLTNDGGVFEAINQGDYFGNIIIHITSDLDEETGDHHLTDIPDFSSIKIIPAESQTKDNPPETFTISGNIAGALININGASNVTIDGNGSNETKDGPFAKRLIFQNHNPVAHFPQ